MIEYYQLGGHKRLSDIVFAGSHDASITSGKWNSRTQSLDIGGQARAGVRLFDLRIYAKGTSDGASLRGYHGNRKGATTRTVTSSHTGQTYNLQVSKGMSAGKSGLHLSDMLNQAKDFVTSSNEFLIFKFDKCTNYQAIADYCTSILGNAIYKPIGIELGKCTLGDLKKKVICVFAESGLEEIHGVGNADGILGFRNMNGKEDPKPYRVDYPGLQYFGKGGTSVAHVYKTKGGKIDENFNKQQKLMLKMANYNMPKSSDALGMMYWTTTGITHSIKDRNKQMWGSTGVRRMHDLWSEALEESIGFQLKQESIKMMQYGKKPRIKAFFPNIVMIDFADEDKCVPIYSLNTAAENRLQDAYVKSQEMGFR